MDDTLLFIPPCCVDKKLPKAVNQAPHRQLTFYTHGDVTAEKFYKAVSHLVIDSHVMVLTMPSPNQETFLFLEQCFEREWITHLVLSTCRPCDTLIAKYLSDYADRIIYAQSDDVSNLSSHIVLYNKDRALTLSGPLFNRPQMDVRLAAYTIVFYPSHLLNSTADWGNPIRNILFPDVLRHRKKMFANGVKRIKDKEIDRFIHLEFPPISE
ncbi:hypothetical protein [uncultured Prevotella sp.]|uniref:hypothetical protein n=1 Tax=uncultured Prevotella sp. TaxID=159272 RepID=UPI002598F4D5|nr:hypothetical protein [uncultured Prevotella sp.]